MKLFNLDSPVMVFLSKVANLMILNVLTIICCIPIFTAGAAITALYYVTIKMARGDDPYIIKGYFKSFKENFKQATIIWLIMLVVIAIIAVDDNANSANFNGLDLNAEVSPDGINSSVVVTSSNIFEQTFSNIFSARGLISGQSFIFGP